MGSEMWKPDEYEEAPEWARRRIQELEAALRDVMNVGDRAAVKVARQALEGRDV